MRHYQKISTMLITGEVASLLNVHPNTVRQWSNLGIMKAYRIGPKGDRRFLRDSIAAFRKNRVSSRHLLSKDA